jgi:hypothetical protein
LGPGVNVLSNFGAPFAGQLAIDQCGHLASNNNYRQPIRPVHQVRHPARVSDAPGFTNFGSDTVSIPPAVETNQTVKAPRSLTPPRGKPRGMRALPRFSPTSKKRIANVEIVFSICLIRVIENFA